MFTTVDGEIFTIESDNMDEFLVPFTKNISQTTEFSTLSAVLSSFFDSFQEKNVSLGHETDDYIMKNQICNKKAKIYVN